MEQQTETAPIDEKRQRQLASLAKARAARAANVLARAESGVEAPSKRKRHKKAVKTRLHEQIDRALRKSVKVVVVGKPVPPDNWLDGIHHAPNGCPYACNATRCAITGENVCAHPDTNLQAKYLAGGFPEVVDRFNAARMEIRRLDAERSLKK